MNRREITAGAGVALFLLSPFLFLAGELFMSLPVLVAGGASFVIGLLILATLAVRIILEKFRPPEN